MNSKRKGNAGEWAFIHWLRSKGRVASRNEGSGAFETKGDIENDLGLVIEVKTVKKASLREFWAQVEGDAEGTHKPPVLAIHLNGMPKDKWLMVIDSEHFISLIK